MLTLVFYKFHSAPHIYSEMKFRRVCENVIFDLC